MVPRNLFVIPIWQKHVLQWVIKLLISLILKVWISDYKNFFGKNLCQNESVGTVNREAEFVYVQFFMFIRGYGYNSYSSMNVVNSSRGPNRGCRWRSVWLCLHDFFNNSQFWVFQNHQRTIRFHERSRKLLSSLYFEFKVFCWVGIKCTDHKKF
jgi:hypothetical protein